MEEYLLGKAVKVKLLILDVDGVLTEGKIMYDCAGEEVKVFHVHDGLGVALLKKAGIPTILLTAKGSPAIQPRARDMQVDKVYENISPKSSVLSEILQKYSLTPEEICFVGDDLVDVCLMKKVGFPVAVFNAVAEVKQKAAYITLKRGGDGAVREIAELILKAQGKWQETLKSYEC